VEGERAKRLRSFLLGGLVGSAAGLVAAGRMKVRREPRRRQTPAGLAAFEQAPCYEELVEREARGDRV
jgi:hypothetical protein